MARALSWPSASPLVLLPNRLHVCREPRLNTRRPGVASHRAWTDDTTEAQGLSTIPVAAALIEVAAATLTDGVVAGDAALRQDLTTRAELDAYAGKWGARPGAARARRLSQYLHAGTESPLESQARLQLALNGIATTPQYIVRDDAGEWVAQVDLLIDGYPIAIEVDGLLKYQSKQDLRTEKRRQEHIEELGLTVVRVTAAQLRDPARFVARVRAAMNSRGRVTS